jgi:hypothetical protein
MRPIDADKLFRDIPLKVCVPCPFGEEKECRDCVIEKVMEMVDDAPTVEPASPWHRVEEELPEPHEYVLCCGKKGGCFVGWTLDNADVVKANGYGRAFVHGVNARTFTHWMPLPEPPKEEK